MVRVLGQHSEACQRTHQPMEGGFMGTSRPGQLGGAFRTGGEMIREADPGGRVHHSRHPIRGSHLDYLRVRRQHGGCGSSICFHLVAPWHITLLQ